MDEIESLGLLSLGFRLSRRLLGVSCRCSKDILLLTTAAYAVLPNTAQWLQQRYGIRTLHVEVHFPATGAETFLDPVREALEKLGGEASRLRLAVFDHVSSYPPAVLPVEALAKQVKVAAPSALVLVDGAHALGQVPISMTALATAGVDFYVTDGHKWLMAPKGSGALWARPSAQPLLEPAIISSDNAPGTSFQSRFDYIGTRDYTPWCAMGSAMDFRRDVLGGEDRIQSYVTGLARWAGRHMADRLGTETVAPDSMTPGMFALRLPLPEDWTPSQKTACSGLIAQGLIGQYSMQVISFGLHTPASDGREEVTHWIRVSAQVYLERSDFEDLTHAVTSLRAKCTSMAKLNTFMLRSMGIGAYHVGVEVLGDEWYFRWSDTAESGIVWMRPRAHQVHVYSESICLGTSELSDKQIRSAKPSEPHRKFAELHFIGRLLAVSHGAIRGFIMVPGSGKPAVQLGGGQASEVPVPVDEEDDDMAEPRKRSGGPEPAPGLPSPKKERSGVVTLDVQRIRELLAEQSRELLGAQQKQLDQAVQDMENKMEIRVAGVEKQVAEAQGRSEVLESKVEQLETALRELTQMVKEGSGPRHLGDDSERRRSTLVFGGWPKDSRRMDILSELKEALMKLGLQADCDEAPFCTGPRRSIALMSVPLRAMETEQGRRSRMFKFVSAFQGHEVSSKSGSKLWCNFSKSPKERAIAAHASHVKRVVAHFDEEMAAGQLDFEYKTGSVWGPQSMLASALLPHPPGVAAKHLLVDEETDHKHWIDVSQVAKLVNKTAKQVRDAIHDRCLQTNLGHFGILLALSRTNLMAECKVQVYGWNVGGAALSDLAKAVCEGARGALDPDAIVLLQELPRGTAGWTSEKQGTLEILSHRSEGAWRGAGLAFNTDSWCVVRRVARSRGCWVLLKHLVHGNQVWCGTAHFTPGCTQAQYESEVTNFFEGTPKGSVPVVCQFDANASIVWNQFDGEVLAVGRDGKANEALGQVESRGLVMVPPNPAQFRTPTSRPRQEGRRGSIIDYMATRGVRRAREIVHVDSCHVLGTDHELLQGELELMKGEAARRAPTAPRVWKGGVDLIKYLDQATLVQLASRCTKPAQGRGYRDPPDVKEAVARARLLRTKASWCTVRSLRKNARKVWESQRVERASQGDWGAFKDAKPKTHAGWQHSFADAQELDPHTVVHDHLQAVYQGRGVKPNKGVYEGDVTVFSEKELRDALSQMKRGKSVGVDGTSTELLQALVDVEGGFTHLLEFMNRTLVTQQIPDDWNTPLMILLPKILEPLEAKHLRPISMNSAVGKLFSRLLLNRTLKYVTARTHSQCAGVGRQSADYLFTVWRLLELEREWHVGLCLLKLDVSKAFDTVDREQLLRTLGSRMGDCAELRCWRALLQDGHALLQSPWGSSLVEMTQGIKQGAVESPGFFSMIAEVCFQEAGERFGWDKMPSAFEGMPHHDVLFMDDGFIWSSGVQGIQQKVRQLMVVLQEFGLKLNGSKCQLLCSPHWKGQRAVWIAGSRVEASPEVDVMELPMRVGMTMSELVSPLVARARSKFWSMHHVFRSKTGLRKRLQTLATAVGNAAMWCLASFPPEKPAMGMLNTMQLQLTMWTMRLARRVGESMGEFRVRAFRAARYALHASGVERWGTSWLRRWWRYAGHRSRCLLRDFPPISAHLDAFRTLEWWETQKATSGRTHPRHYPRLANMERAMNAAARGEWRMVAHNRTVWQGLEQTWVDSMDLPWARKPDGSRGSALLCSCALCEAHQSLFANLRTFMCHVMWLLSVGLAVVKCHVQEPPRDLLPDFLDSDRPDPGTPGGVGREQYHVRTLNYTIQPDVAIETAGDASGGQPKPLAPGRGSSVDYADGPERGDDRDGDSRLCEAGRRVLNHLDEAFGTTAHMHYEIPAEDVAFMQEASRPASAKRAHPRPDRPCEEWVEGVIADFRQLVDQGQGRLARRSLMMELQRRCHSTPTDLAEEVLGSALDDESLLPMRARRYPVDMETWVHRVTQELERCSRECALRRPRITPAASSRDPEHPFGIFHAAHVWRDGTWSSAEDLVRMGREDLLPQNKRRPTEEDEDREGNGEPDEEALFQTGMEPRPVRRWEDLIEQFWQWWDEERALGIAVMMMRRLANSRADAEYRRWAVRPCDTLGAGIPNSEGETEDTSPADFMRWAVEAEDTLYAIYLRETAEVLESEGDAAGDAANRDHQRGRARDRDEANRRCGPAGGDRREHPNLASAPWRTAGRPRPEPASGSRDGASGSRDGAGGTGSHTESARGSDGPGAGGARSGEARFDDFNATMLFFPTGPRDSDAGVDIWRYLLGIGTSDLPRGREVIGAGGPLIPDNRAEWMVEVLRDYTTQQQMIMTIALVTTVRALLTELGQIMHQASLVEVDLDEDDTGGDRRAGGRGDEDDETGLMQLGEVMFVQKGVTMTYGVLLDLQKEFEGPSPGLARLRALNMRKQLQQLRVAAKLEEKELADQLDALCVATAEAGRGYVHEGFLASEEQLNAWTWAWFLKLVPPLKLRGRRGSASTDPAPVTPVPIGSQSSSARSQSTICPTLVAMGEHEQQLERRDSKAMDDAQAAFEYEEDLYYKGVEKAVEEHMRAEESHNYQAWDDWALYDEMHGPRARVKRRRLMLEVSVGPREGQPGTSQTVRVPWTSTGSQVVVTMQTKMESDDEDATTVRASPGRSGGADIPLDFGEYMDLFTQWSQGMVSSAEVKTRYGETTLDMLETQMVVKAGALDDEDDGDTDEPGQGSLGVGGVGPIVRDPGDVQPLSTGSVSEGMGANASQRAETLLDAVLSCTQVENAETLVLQGAEQDDEPAGRCEDADAGVQGDDESEPKGRSRSQVEL
ncbi:lolT1 [Symbiodinium sp. CCMP2592]|nr:lolT1 [Symbiodinium sp. CCMP2592]